METRETYKKAVEMAEAYRNMVELYDRLIGAGIPKKMVQWFKFPSVSSGYSMGERVTIAVNGVDIAKRDQRKYYTGRYYGREKHGNIFIRLSKRELREYVELCHERAMLDDWREETTMEKRCANYERRMAIIEKGFVSIASTVKDFLVY